jgi:histidine kinase
MTSTSERPESGSAPSGGRIAAAFRGLHQIWWKLLLTYLAVAAVCLGVVIFIIYEISSSTYDSHIERMSRNGMSMMMSSPMMKDLQDVFREAITSSLIWGTAAAVTIAVFLSIIISRRITRPIHDMAAVTERIAEGDYGQRVSAGSRDEIGTLAESLNGMAARLEESQKLRRELMANIAHELRTPLTSISGYMEGLEDGVVPANPETYQLVRREAERLGRLVEDLQRLSRAESGQEKLDIIGIPAASFAERTAKKMMTQFADKGVDLNTVVSPDAPDILADEDKLDQILVNLLDNALRYTDSGGTVSLSVGNRDGQALIEVADTGHGISEADLPYIFERFYRADKSRARVSGGTGIGLTIVKSYVDALNGRIQVDSIEGKGSRFKVILPASA